MVRVFVPAAPGEAPLAGMVEHVGTGWSTHFGSGNELLAAFNAWLEREQVSASVPSATDAKERQ